MIVFPEAKTNRSFHLNVFVTLAKRIRQSGFEVFINTQERLFNDQEVGIFTLFPPLDILLGISKLIGKFLGVRSGVCDLISLSSSDIIFVYPDEKTLNYSTMTKITK